MFTWSPVPAKWMMIALPVEFHSEFGKIISNLDSGNTSCQCAALHLLPHLDDSDSAGRNPGSIEVTGDVNTPL